VLFHNYGLCHNLKLLLLVLSRISTLNPGAKGRAYCFRHYIKSSHKSDRVRPHSESSDTEERGENKKKLQDENVQEFIKVCCSHKRQHVRIVNFGFFLSFIDKLMGE
jgi:hypothetical protein